MIQEARKWYSTTSNKTGELNWEQAKIITGKDSQQNVVIPYPFKYQLEKGSRSIRRVIITMKQSGFEGTVLVIIATDEYGKQHATFKGTEFSGVSGRYDLNMNFLYGEYYEHGQPKYKASFLSFPNRLAYERTVKTERDCKFFEDSYIDSDGVFTVYGYSVCTDEEGGGSGGGVYDPPWDGGIGGGGGSGVSNPGGGGPGHHDDEEPLDPPAPPPPSKVQTIVNELKNPCLVEAFNATTNAKLANVIKTTIANVFGGSNSNIDLFFRERPNSDFPDGVYGEYDRVESHVNPYEKDDPTSDLVGQIFINLNVDVLPSKPKELIVTVILHESLHAFLKQEGINFDKDWRNQHEVMATGYRDKISAALREIFPNLSQADSETLAWMGLQETMSWSANQFSDLKNNDNKFYNLVAPVLDFQNGTKGTPSGCK